MSTSPNTAADFSAGNVKIADGNLIYKTGFLFFSHTHSCPIDAIGSIRARKTWWGFGSPEVIIREFNVTGEESTYSLKHTFKISGNKFDALYKAIAAQGTAPVFSQALQLVVCGDKVLSPSQIPGAAKELLGKNDSVWIYNDRVITDNKRYPSNDLAIPYIHFLKQDGKLTNWGYKARSYAEGLSKKAFTTFKEAIRKLGAPIGGDPGKTYEGKKGWFGLKFWQRKESLTVGKEGVTFEYRKGKKNESIYLPYVDMASIGKGKKLNIYGAQNIISKCNFPSEAREAVRKNFKSDFTDFTGEVMKSRFMLLGLIKLWARPKHGSIEYSNTGLLIHPSEAELKADRKNKSLLIAPDMKIEMENVDGYYRKGRKLIIVVNSGNVREWNKDQNEGYFNILYFQKQCGAGALASTLSDKCPNTFGAYTRGELKKMLKNHKF